MSKTQDTNTHASNATTARFKHVDGGSGQVLPAGFPGRLLRVILNTNGATLTLKNGASEVVAIIALDAPEQTFNYGVWCSKDIRFETGGAVDATIVFAA